MTNDEKLLFGERLRKLRTAKGYTQESMAERLGLSLRYYQMLERGEHVGSVDVLISICSILSASLDYLLLGKMPESGTDEEGSFATRFNSLPAHTRTSAARLLDLWIEESMK